MTKTDAPKASSLQSWGRVSSSATAMVNAAVVKEPAPDRRQSFQRPRIVRAAPVQETQAPG